MDDSRFHDEGFSKIYSSITGIIENARANVYRSINFNMVLAYRNIGKVIVEVEQKGKNRADYGQNLIEKLSIRLTEDFGKGFNQTNLKYMRTFYLKFQKGHALRDELSWTHYRHLLRVEKDDARHFYLLETANNNWSTRELERQINSLLYERLAISKNKIKTKELSIKGQMINEPKDIIKDPYVLEFLGVKNKDTILEKDLENMLINKLKVFLLELGKGFAFIDRQKRITLDNEHYHIDLVFYNYILKCFVLIDLKLGKLKHKDIGQMDFYVRYFEKEKRKDTDNPTIGIILCSDKNDVMVKYTLLDESRNIFASRYRLCLPTEKDLEDEIKRERRAIEFEKRFKKNRLKTKHI